MNEEEKIKLKKLYKQMTDAEIIEMLSANKWEFEEGIYELVLDEAKGRNIEKTRICKAQGKKKIPVIEKVFILLFWILLGVIIPPILGFLLHYIILALGDLSLCRLSGEEGWIITLSFYTIPLGAIIGGIVGLIIGFVRE